MRFVDLPDELVHKIDAYAREPGEAAHDVWMQATIYEHRIRGNRFVTQLVLSELRVGDLQFDRLVSALRRIAHISTYARTEQSGTRTLQIIGMGHQVTALMRGTGRVVYSVVDDRHVAFTVEENTDAPLARLLDGVVLTLIAPPSHTTFGGHGRPTIRMYDCRVTQRRVCGSKGLQSTHRHHWHLLRRLFTHL
jgi:hypothetical protein